MPRFQYTAIAAGGRKVKGTINAENAYAARKQLRVREMHASDIKEISSAEQGKRALFPGLRRAKRGQIVDFTKQASTLLNSGIKLTEALSVLMQQTNDSRFKTALTEIRDRVVTGESFTDALKEYDDYFDVIYVAMVRVGEVTGTLGESLKTIASFMEKRQRVEAKILTAMIYPIVLVCFCVLAILILTTKVIPQIGAQIKQSGQQLPWITQQLMNFSHLLMSWWILVMIAGIVGFGVGIQRLCRTQRGAYTRDKILLSLPFFGPLIKQRVVARFASTLSTLIGSGLAMAESLRVVAETTGNTLMKRAIQQARERILAGADIATPLRDSGVIDPAIAHMVAVGEKSGELETMLKNISENLESSTDVVIERLSAAVEPLIIIVMAGVVGVIAYATLLPIIRISVKG
jgi:general secretion pathway protein F